MTLFWTGRLAGNECGRQAAGEMDDMCNFNGCIRNVALNTSSSLAINIYLHDKMVQPRAVITDLRIVSSYRQQGTTYDVDKNESQVASIRLKDSELLRFLSFFRCP